MIGKSAPTETCQGLPINPGRITFVPSRLYNQCSTIFLACVLRSPQKLGEGTKLLTSSAQGPPSQLNLHVLSPRSVLMFSVLAQSCLWLKLSGRRLLVRPEKSVKHSGRREDSRRRLTGVKTVGNLHLEEIFCLEKSSGIFKTSVLRKRTRS